MNLGLPQLPQWVLKIAFGFMVLGAITLMLFCAISVYVVVAHLHFK